MSLLDRLRGSPSESDAEQLAPDDPAPRGEDREDGDSFIVSVFGGGLRSRFDRSSTSTTDQGGDREIEAARSRPASDLETDHRSYYREVSFTRSGLDGFARTITEPGYVIEATVDGGTDEDMQTALRTWASQCAIVANEPGEDLLEVLKRAPVEALSKGTGFVEKAGSSENPDSIAALVYLSPSTFTQYTRKHKPIVVQPDDEVSPDHPRTPTDDAAAYVQHDTGSRFEREPVNFGRRDLIKLTHDPEPGSPWGTPVWEACGDRIDALYEKLDDRDMSIHTVGHAHRIYSSPNWSMEQAREYADAHKSGEVSAGPRVGDHSNDRESYRQSWPGRVDFVPEAVEVKTVEGEVADIGAAVKDDIEAIFAALPVSKFKLGYAEDINQFVVEPQAEHDQKLVDEWRRTLERKFGPVIEEKADELAGGEYDGDVSFRIEAEPESNPLQRQDFPRENLTALSEAVKEINQAGADPALIDAVLSHAGIDREQVEAEFGDRYEPDELDEGDEQVQQQFEGQQQGDVATDGGAEQ
jgi:hypothetical protein